MEHSLEHLDSLPNNSSEERSPFFLAFINVVVNVFGSFLSIAAVGIVYFFKTVSRPHLFQAIHNGEAIIICISLLISALYALFECKNLKGKINRLVFWSTLLIIIISLLFYPLFIEQETLNNNTTISQLQLSQYKIIKIISIILFLITTGLVYFITYTNYSTQSTQAPTERNKEYHSLKDKFDLL
jgi:hypothetical protein